MNIKLNRNQWSDRTFQLKKILLCGATAFTFLTGCSTDDSDKEDSFHTMDISKRIVETTESMRDVLPVLNHEEYNEFMEYLKSIQIDYLYDDLYGVDEAYESYLQHKDLQLKEYDHENLTIDFSTLTALELVDIIKNNNEKNLSKVVKTLGNGETLKQFTDEELLHMSKIILYTIKKDAEKHPTWDKETMNCNLSHLSLFNVDRSGILGQYETIESIQSIMLNRNAIENQEEEDKVLSHEIAHMWQDQCVEKKTNSDTYYYGYMKYLNYQLQVNPMFWRLFSEANAELDASAIYKEKYETYKTKISVFNLLKYVAAIQPGEKTLDQCETLEELFQLFQCNTDSEKKEFITAIYGIEFSTSYSSHFDFIQAYEKKTGISIETVGDVEGLYRPIQTSSYQFFTKCFFRNLAQLSVENQLTVEDNLYLISVYEELVNSELSMILDEYYEENKKFYDVYREIKDSYLESIRISIGNRKEPLKQLYLYESQEDCKFRLTENKKIGNYNNSVISLELKNINKDKREFIQELLGRDSDIIQIFSMEREISHAEENYYKESHSKVKTYE